MKSDFDFINRAGDKLAGFLIAQKEINEQITLVYKQNLQEKNELIERQNKLIDSLNIKLKKLEGKSE